MNSRDWRRRCFRRDLIAAATGLCLVALTLAFTQTRPFYALIKSALAEKVTRANINGSTEFFLKDGQVTDEELKGPPAAVIRWKASRQAMGKPTSPLWEQGAVDITAVQIKDPAVTETQVRAFVETHGLGGPLPNFVGARDISIGGKSKRAMFPTPSTEIHHVDRAFPTFRTTWPRNFRLAVAVLITLMVASLLFPRTLICTFRSRRQRCLRCGYDRRDLPACPECNLDASPPLH